MKAQLQAAAIGAVLAGAIMLGLLLQQRGAARYERGMLRDSIEARNDTTRKLELRNGVLGKGLEAVQHRVLQLEQTGDSLDRALTLERKLRVDAIGTVDRTSVQGTLTPISVATAPMLTQRDSFQLRQQPYSVAGVVVRPPRPARDTIRMSIELDTVTIGIRASCGAKNKEGVRLAQLTAVTPSWLHVRLGDVQQAPEICNPRPRSWASSWFTLAGLRDRIGVSAGVDASMRPTAIAGIRVFP